jgi:hypothetical protein
MIVKTTAASGKGARQRRSAKSKCKTTARTVHRQTKVRHPREGLIEVDEGIAPLLKLLWKLGIDTFMSCERQEARPDCPIELVWIMFRSTQDLAKFLYWSVDRESYNLDYRVTLNRDYLGDAATLTTLASVRFPCADFPRVLRAIERVVEARRKGWRGDEPEVMADKPRPSCWRRIGGPQARRPRVAATIALGPPCPSKS